MQIHQLRKPKHIKRHQRVGRGGSRGTFSGRGVKGQKSRAGARIRPSILDYIARIPKLRGQTRKSKDSKYGRSAKNQRPIFSINVGALNDVAKDGDTITPAYIVRAKLLRRHKGLLPRVKVLGEGTFQKKVTTEGMGVSASARKKIEEAGGEVVEKNAQKA
jgi:large subunit ribosomal protein L15